MFISKQNLTVRDLREFLDYDPITGHLTWIKKLSRKVVVGKRAGTQVKGRDNRIIKIFGEVYIEHRLIWFMVTGKWPVHDIDHEDHNESNNSWGNLYEKTRLENCKNNSLRSDNRTGIVGVWVNQQNSKKKYRAEINHNGSRKARSFTDLNDAISQRKIWEKEFGFHANHGIQKPI